MDGEVTSDMLNISLFLFKNLKTHYVSAIVHVIVDWSDKNMEYCIMLKLKKTYVLKNVLIYNEICSTIE